MGDIRVEAAAGDLKSAERAAAAADDQAQRTRLALKKAKKASKKAAKAARKAHKAVKAASKALAKATSRAKKEARSSKKERAQSAPATVKAAPVKKAAAGVAPKSARLRKGARTKGTQETVAAQKRSRRATSARPAKRPRPLGSVPVSATGSMISAGESLDGSETFVLGEPSPN